MRLLTTMIVALAAMAGAGDAWAQETRGDAGAGQRLAGRWCSSCHQSGGDGAAKDRAPTFEQIARLPSTTALSLRVFLRTSHPNMPNIQLTPAETDDVVAYILSLKSQ
jgi:mono/diheme cytochrome c family protein